ncbi:unnamed protein product, partial [Trichobilharzia regenti]
MTIHPFGATSSPFCANFALRKAVSTFGSNDLLDVIDCCFYVDDCLASFDDDKSAVRFATSITEVLAKNGIDVRILMGKSRVAPLRTISIPRLELTAALLVVQLFTTVCKELDYPKYPVTFWT